VLALAGKSGCGKTTLVKCIYGLEDLQAGEIKIDGELVTGPAYNLIPGHKDMSLVSQDFYVLDNHTVAENITDKLIGYTDEYKQKRASQLLKLLELNHLKDTKARFLSSGQKQRVAIARALTIIPKLLLLDEPFSNLDKLLTDKLFAFINKEVKRDRTSVILVTHAAEEAIKYADRIAIMDEGKITQIGEKWQVYYEPKNTRLAGLLGDYNIIRKEDLEKNSRNRIRSKIILRPDKIKLSEGKNSARLPLTVTNCTYNGKCFELLAETKSGHTVILYSAREIKEEREIITYIEN
jgi:ABC-type Fe3+/spermidine/putrescine transport system ATPase subunit